MIGDDREHEGVLRKDLGGQVCHTVEVGGDSELPDQRGTDAVLLFVPGHGECNFGADVSRSGVGDDVVGDADEFVSFEGAEREMRVILSAELGELAEVFRARSEETQVGVLGGHLLVQSHDRVTVAWAEGADGDAADRGLSR